MSGEEKVKVVELRELDEPPIAVAGNRAFVLFHPEVGRVEVGDPKPDDDVWNHFSGDLMHLAVHEINGGITSTGGDTWDSQELNVLWSEPGTGTAPGERAWVVIGRIPPVHETITLDHDGNRFSQAPMRGTAAFPLDNDGGSRFVISGIDSAGSETVLFTSRE